MATSTHRIGFISTRLAGTDGVSLEVVKWVNVLNKLGCQCFFFAGESDWPPDRSYVVSEAHFNHPVIRHLNADLFDDRVRQPETSRQIHELKDHIKKHLHIFVKQFDLHLLVVENALAIPMNVPLGLAITELVAETSIPTIAHHHDFAWERTRFVLHAADDYLRAAFPSTLRSMHHVVINSFASHQLALRTGASSITMIPNVMDFEQQPPAPEGYAADLRAELGIAPDERFLLQPTRVVPRKRIEQAVYLAHRLGVKHALVISHSSGDEGHEYAAYLQEHADAFGVKLIFAAERFNHNRGLTADGRKIYSLPDAYQQADLVTYPSNLEGFGNAFLEAVYYQRPLVMSTYDIFKTDIQPKGFRVIGFEDFVTPQCVAAAREALGNPALVQEMVAHNYQLGERHYSYTVLETHLSALLSQSLGAA